jgi:hypothetical protein
MTGERTRLVESVWTLLTDKRVPLTVLHYNALLRVHLENKHRYLSPIEEKRRASAMADRLRNLPESSEKKSTWEVYLY